MPDFAVILAAAGKSSRFSDPNFKKPFVTLKQKAVWLHSAELFLKRNDVRQVIIVIDPEDKADFLSRFGPNVAILGIDVVLGGAERTDSVRNGLQKVAPSIDFVAIHDAARPCIDADLVERVFQAAIQTGAAIPALSINSTVKRSTNGKTIDSTIDRDGLYLAQTPQVFRRDLINELYQKPGSASVTDESQLAERNGVDVAIVDGSPFNIKITRRNDLRFAAACLDAMPQPRFDAPIHPFANDNLLR